MNNLNIDLAIQCVKSLVDNCRCVNCDHLDGTRSRYNCGHSVCKDCPVIYDACLLCSPTSNPTLAFDKPQSERAQHASELLNSFQDLFNVDVYRKQRISEQLKIEKEIFPECIQAPVTYYNKRKSSSLTEKHNIRPSLVYDDNILKSNKRKMENSTNYVQEWLDQNQSNFQKKRKSRKPLSDLSINTSNSLNIIKDNKFNTSNRKRQLNKSELTDNIYEYKTYKKARNETTHKKCQNHESGILLDDDVCVINDSQSEIMDKDRLALMAVLEADKNAQSSSMDADLDLNEDIYNKVETKPISSTSTYKIPFYKKGILLEICEKCAKYTDQNMFKKNIFNTNNVSVTIESKSFLTTIKFTEIKPNNNVVVCKSIAIQTDTEHYDAAMSKNEATINENLYVSKHNENQSNNYGSMNKTKGIVIEDSDTDSSGTHDDSKEIEVQADVHKPSNFIDYIFKPLESQEYGNRIIPKIRGKTPASSDSSDKENYDPNKRKQSKAGTKNIKNKKFKL